MLNKLYLEEEPKEKAPLDVVIYKKKIEEIEDSWKRPQPQPTVDDIDDIRYHPPEEKKKKEPERGVWKMYS